MNAYLIIPDYHQKTRQIQQNIQTSNRVDTYHIISICLTRMTATESMLQTLYRHQQ